MCIRDSGGSASIANGLDVTLTQVAPAANDRGLLLNGASKVYFDDGTTFDQYIGSKTADGGITIVTAPTSLELDGGALVDIDADGITIDADGAAGMGLTTTLGDLTFTTPAAKKILFNTNIAGAISHTSDAVTEDFTIEQLGAVDASLMLSSAGTGVDAIAISASAGGIDITATGTANGEDLDITAVGATTELKLTSASTEFDAINLQSDDGGIYLEAGLDADEAIKLHATGGSEQTIIIQNTAGTTAAGDDGGAIGLNAQAGGVAINAGTDLTIDAATALEINSSGGTIKAVSYTHLTLPTNREV